MRTAVHAIAVLALLGLVAGLGGRARASGDSRIAQRIEAAGPAPAIEVIAAADYRLQGVQSLPYDPLAAAHREAPLGAFRVETRVPKVKSAPCEACHVEDRLASSRGHVPAPEALAHGAIVIAHAPVERMACDSCHDFRNAMAPKTVTGAKLDFDRSYELCAGCHASQYSDWRGGAHGKRLANWAGTRVVKPCAGCHDPHRPAFLPRAPAIFAAPPSSWEILRR